MKGFFQLIDSKTGQRTPAIGQDRVTFANGLRSIVPQDEQESALVIVLVDDADASEWKFSQAPVLTVANFIKHFATTEVASNE